MMRDIHKQIRFRRPEFQEKLARARKYVRKQTPVPVSFGGTFLRRVGLGSRHTRILVGILLLLIVYFLTVSEMFLVGEAVLASDNKFNPEQIELALEHMGRKRVYFVPESHILLLNQNNLLTALQKESPEIRTIKSMKKLFPNKLELELERREPLYIWQGGEEYYFLDQDGVIFQQIANYKPAEFSQVLIADRLAGNVARGEDLEIKKILGFVEQIKSLWASQVSQVNFVSFSVAGKKSLDVFVRTSTGFEVYFDLNRSVKNQLINLALLLNQEIRQETYSGLSYIDVRLPDIAYYCYKDAPCAPEFQK